MRKAWIAWMGCLVPAAVGAEPVAKIQVVNDRAPDCSSLESILQTVTRGCQTDDQRVIALYNFCRYDHYHHAYPSEPGGIGALKLINVYGWGLCGGQHTVMAALWEVAGYPWRYRGWSRPGHTTVEVFYGGRWHYLDSFLKFYCWMPDAQSPGGRTLAGQEDIRASPSLVSDQFVLDPVRRVWYHRDNRFDYVPGGVNWTAPAFLVCGDTMESVLTGIRSSRNAGSPRGWGGIRFDEPDYATDVNLDVGFALTLHWNKQPGAFYFRGRQKGPQHTCGDKDYRNCPAIGPLLEPYRELDPARSWSNGTLVFRPDFRNDAFLASFSRRENVVWRDGTLRPEHPNRPAVVAVDMASPYVVAAASGSCRPAGGGEGTAEVEAEVSSDGQSWTPVDLEDFSQAVRGTYRYTVRLSFAQPLAGLELTSVVQHNQEALPYLAPGRNRVTVTADRLGDKRLVVTYAYLPGWRDRTPEELFQRDAEIARGHFATWSDTPRVVQKMITQSPTTFEIPVATPKDKQPVYPRMLFLRREVLAPGQRPAPVPAVPTQPVVGPGEYLPDVPTPWLVGTGEPKTPDDRPVDSVVVPARRVSYVSMQGEVFSHQFIKWLKDNSNAWILLADFQLPELPEPRRVAGARLIVYVEGAHDRAPMEAAAVMLSGPFEPGAAFDFGQLGLILGRTIIQRGGGPGAPFQPPRRYQIDVTRAVRAWAGGQPPYGLALRIVPNRGVDDGWTVRFTPDRERPVELEIMTYRQP